MDPIYFPEGYQQVMPYLIVKHAEGFMQFAKEILGAEEKLKIMRDEHLIMHAELVFGRSVIMLADATDLYPVQTAGIFLYVRNAEAIYLAALAGGAISLLEPSMREYGYSCGIKDPYGIIWWLTEANT
jgi:PhnB protein